MRSPPPAANNSSVTCGAIEMMRCAGVASVTERPASSTTVTPAATPAPGKARQSVAIAAISVNERRLKIIARRQLELASVTWVNPRLAAKRVAEVLLVGQVQAGHGKLPFADRAGIA